MNHLNISKYLVLDISSYLPVNQMGMSMMMLKKLLTAHDSNISVSVSLYLRWNSSLLNTPSSQSVHGNAKLMFWRM